MELESLRLLTRGKLQEGLLPSDSIPSVWGDPGNGETCDGCDSTIESPYMVIEGISLSDGSRPLDIVDRRRPLQLHVTCFYVWDVERRGPAA
jgi:hypothetical protein